MNTTGQEFDRTDYELRNELKDWVKAELESLYTRISVRIANNYLDLNQRLIAMEAMQSRMILGVDTVMNFTNPPKPDCPHNDVFPRVPMIRGEKNKKECRDCGMVWRMEWVED